MKASILGFLLSMLISFQALAGEDLELLDFNQHLHFLYFIGDFEGFRSAALKEKHYSIDQVNAKGFTVLQLAAMQGKTKWVEMLLSLGANIEYRDPKHRRTAYMWALYADQWKTSQLLKNNGARVIWNSM